MVRLKRPIAANRITRPHLTITTRMQMTRTRRILQSKPIIIKVIGFWTARSGASMRKVWQSIQTCKLLRQTSLGAPRGSLGADQTILSYKASASDGIRGSSHLGQYDWRSD